MLAQSCLCRLTIVALITCLAAAASAQVCNLKIVTDASPDYSDMDSMIRSITSRWETTPEKMWAMYYWNHKARKQTSPMLLHGYACTDPIRQFNDYGYMMCSTISGANCSIWDAMGFPVKYWDVITHTVCEVQYDDRWHMYDNSVSAIYTLCDGKTIAGVQDLAKELGCEASGGKVEPFHLVLYHSLNATSPKGYVTGCDMHRPLEAIAHDFATKGLKYRPYYNDWDRGHRSILNVRPGESYKRYYRRLDVDSKDAVPQGKDSKYTAAPDYFVPNENGLDAEALNPRYRIRGNGEWSFDVPATQEGLARAVHSMKGVVCRNGAIQCEDPAAGGEVILKIAGANVITSLMAACDTTASEGNTVSYSVSRTNGLTWTDPIVVESGQKRQWVHGLREPVNGSYEVLARFQLKGTAAIEGIRFKTITQVNTKTQPKLNIGKNTVYVGAGEQTDSIVVWPELQGGKYRPWVAEEKNTAFDAKASGYTAVLYARKAQEEACVVFKVDAPRDVTKVTYGGRLYNRTRDAHIDFLHSFDGGKTWNKSYSLAKTDMPWDVLHFETIADVPPGTKSVLFKYAWNGYEAGASSVGLYACRMEVNCKPVEPVDVARKPLEVVFTWKERQEDYSLVQRSHRQVVTSLPCTYTVNVGGADHPQMESLEVRGLTQAPAASAPSSPYIDGQDAGGERFVPRWATYGKNLALGKSYEASMSGNNWGAGDPEGKRLTDGLVGAYYTGAGVYPHSLIWAKGQPEIVVDLGAAQKLAAVRIHLGGYPEQDALKGQVKDKVEVFTSSDGKEWAAQGEVNLKLRWKDLPANLMYPDEETLCAYNFDKVLDKPVEARYVKYKLTVGPGRFLAVTELQVLDGIKYEPFDLRLAPPK